VFLFTGLQIIYPQYEPFCACLSLEESPVRRGIIHHVVRAPLKLRLVDVLTGTLLLWDTHSSGSLLAQTQPSVTWLPLVGCNP